jgi:hypothetical protein
LISFAFQEVFDSPLRFYHKYHSHFDDPSHCHCHCFDFQLNYTQITSKLDRSFLLVFLIQKFSKSQLILNLNCKGEKTTLYAFEMNNLRLQKSLSYDYSWRLWIYPKISFKGLKYFLFTFLRELKFELFCENLTSPRV